MNYCTKAPPSNDFTLCSFASNIEIMKEGIPQEIKKNYPHKTVTPEQVTHSGVNLDLYREYLEKKLWLNKKSVELRDEYAEIKGYQGHFYKTKEERQHEHGHDHHGHSHNSPSSVKEGIGAIIKGFLRPPTSKEKTAEYEKKKAETKPAYEFIRELQISNKIPPELQVDFDDEIEAALKALGKTANNAALAEEKISPHNHGKAA